MTNSAMPMEKADRVRIHTWNGILDFRDTTGLLLRGSEGFGDRFGEDAFEQRTAGRVEEDAAFLKLGQVHQRVADAEAFELCEERGVAGQAEANVVDGLGGPVHPVALRADEMHKRMAVGVKPVAWDAVDGARPLAFHQVEDGHKEGL